MKTHLPLLVLSTQKPYTVSNIVINSLLIKLRTTEGELTLISINTRLRFTKMEDNNNFTAIGAGQLLEE